MVFLFFLLPLTGLFLIIGLLSRQNFWIRFLGFIWAGWFGLALLFW